MTRTMHGILRNGSVELRQTPPATDAGDVVVVVVNENSDSAVPDHARDAIMTEMFEEMDLGFKMGGRLYAKRGDFYDRYSRP